MIITGNPFYTTLSVINLVLHHLEYIIVALLGMRNGAAGAVLETVSEGKVATALEQVERTPAEEA
jgi:hypothetical protein